MESYHEQPRFSRLVDVDDLCYETTLTLHAWRRSVDRVMQRVSDMLARCSGPEEHRPFPPTIFCNENWMLRLILDWFGSHRAVQSPRL